MQFISYFIDETFQEKVLSKTDISNFTLLLTIQNSFLYYVFCSLSFFNF